MSATVSNCGDWWDLLPVTRLWLNCFGRRSNLIYCIPFLLYIFLVELSLKTMLRILKIIGTRIRGYLSATSLVMLVIFITHFINTLNNSFLRLRGTILSLIALILWGYFQATDLLICSFQVHPLQILWLFEKSFIFGWIFLDGRPIFVIILGYLCLGLTSIALWFFFLLNLIFCFIGLVKSEIKLSSLTNYVNRHGLASGCFLVLTSFSKISVTIGSLDFLFCLFSWQMDGGFMQHMLIIVSVLFNFVLAIHYFLDSLQIASGFISIGWTILMHNPFTAVSLSIDCRNL